MTTDTPSHPYFRKVTRRYITNNRYYAVLDCGHTRRIHYLDPDTQSAYERLGIQEDAHCSRCETTEGSIE